MRGDCWDKANSSSKVGKTQEMIPIEALHNIRIGQCALGTSRKKS